MAGISTDEEIIIRLDTEEACKLWNELNNRGTLHSPVLESIAVKLDEVLGSIVKRNNTVRKNIKYALCVDSQDRE